MEVSIKIDKNKYFIPFTLTLKIETMAELLNLYQRMSNDKIGKICNSLDKDRKEGSMNCYKIWSLLQERIEQEEHKVS